MKTWKNYFIGFLVILITAFTFIACNEDEEKADPCNCDPKAHLGIDEKCNCGGSACGCSEQVAWLGNSGIKIRRASNVSSDEMTSTVNEIILPAFNTNSNTISVTSETITEIRILDTGKAWIYGLDKVLTINRNTIDKSTLALQFSNITTGMPPGYDVDGPIK